MNRCRPRLHEPALWLTDLIGRSTSALLTSYLRIPLPWYHSQTLALFPDETHSSISKTFVPPHAPHSQRKFCGYCGTHLSYWTEQPEGEEDYLQVNVGSLSGADLAILEQLGILDDLDESSATEGDEPSTTALQANQVDSSDLARRDHLLVSEPTRLVRQGTTGDLSWFEELIDGSRLGRTSKTRKGHGHSADGTTSISWEVSEYADGDLDSPAESSHTPSTRAKRKIGDVAIDDDTTMA